MMLFGSERFILMSAVVETMKQACGKWIMGISTTLGGSGRDSGGVGGGGAAGRVCL